MNMRQARTIYKAEGKHFFDRDTMEFWGTRTETDLLNNRCFVTSEDNFTRTERLYTVRQFNETYTGIETVGEFQQFSTLAAAVEYAEQM